MSSLAKCLKIAGKALTNANRVFIMKANKRYINEGMLSKDAMNRALEDYIHETHGNVSEYEKEILLKGGDPEASQFDIYNEISTAKGIRITKPANNSLSRLLSENAPKPTPKDIK